jgi:hypothetical protein
MDQRLVVAALQIDLWLPPDAVVDDKIETVAIADRGYGAMSAIPEQLIDLIFAGEIDGVTELLL